MSNFAPERATDSVWRATAGAVPSFPARQVPDRADVVIIGAGYTGLWTALHLLREQPELSVVVLERTTVGFGASGRNGGWASALFPTSLERMASFSSREQAIAMQRAMYQVVDDLAAWTQEESIDCEYAKGGTITVARNASQVQSLRQDIEHDEAWGAGHDDVRFLDAHQTRARIGMEGALAGKYTPHCAALHPLKLVHGLALAVSRRGGVILEGTAALSYSPGVVSTNRGVITCDSVIRATEGFTARFDAHVREVMPVYSLMIATEPLTEDQWDIIGLRERETFTEQQHVVVYGQRTADGRLAFGGRGAPYHWGSAVDARFDSHPSVHGGLHKTLLELFPVLAGTRVSHRWGGALGIPRDYMPFVRFTDGVGAAGGYVGDGVASAALAGRTMADLVLRRATERTALPWVNHRGRNWEPEPLRWLEANGMLAGLRLADRMEAKTGKPSPLANLLYRFL